MGVVNFFNASRDLFLLSVCESEDGALAVSFCEGKVGLEMDSERLNRVDSDIRSLFFGAKPIEKDPRGRRFVLFWDFYVAYSVLNESYALPEKGALQYSEGGVVEYGGSVYLDYVSKATFARDDYPGKLRHWRINCLDHVVDVVSTDPPKVEVT